MDCVGATYMYVYGYGEKVCKQMLNKQLCNFAKLLFLQNSLFLRKLLESKPLNLGVLDVSQGLDSNSFPQNLES